MGDVNGPNPPPADPIVDSQRDDNDNAVALSSEVVFATSGERDSIAAPPGRGWIRDAAFVVGGQGVSGFGSILVSFAVTWHLALQTGSGMVLAWAIVFSLLPTAIVSIFGGVWADRHNRKVLIIAADAAIAIFTLLLAWLLRAGINQLWVFYFVLAIRSAFAGLQQPAATALIPQIVPADSLLRVNGISQSIMATEMLIAPGVAAVLLSRIGIEAVLIADVVTAVIGIALLLAVPVQKAVRSADYARDAVGSVGVANNATGAANGEVADAKPSYFGDLIAGFRYVIANPAFLWLTGVMTVFTFLLGGPMNLTTLMVPRYFSGEAWSVETILAVNESVWAVGFLLSGLIITAVASRTKNRMALILGVCPLLATLSILLGWSPNVWTFFGFGFLIAFAASFVNTPIMTILQETVTEEMQGRVFGLVGVLMSLATPLSMLIYGPASDFLSLRVLLYIGGIAMLVVFGVVMCLPAARRSFASVAYKPAEIAE